MTADDMKNKKLLLVLGMHRSGTSLISRCLTIFGAGHGNHLLPATVDNLKGHWEDKDFFILNEQMLEHVGKTWNSALPLTSKDIELLCASKFFDSAVNLLRDRFSSLDLFALKEPRMTKLLAFWLKVFDHVSIKVDYIFALRHPISVANSLKKRSNIPVERGLLLWYSYNAYALLALRKKKILFIDYDDFLQCPQTFLEKIAHTFNLIQNQEETKLFLDSFLDKSMRNFSKDNMQEYKEKAKPYFKFYAHILKHAHKNHLSVDFYDDYAKNTIYTTLEQMSNKESTL